jgi:hypothetical protein
MKTIKENGINWGEKVKTSELFIKAIKEGRIGGAGHKDGHLHDKTKEKISQSLKKYYKNSDENTVNIELHRNAMAKAVGICVEQYSIEGDLIKTYKSIAEAAREIIIQVDSFSRLGKELNEEASWSPLRRPAYTAGAMATARA